MIAPSQECAVDNECTLATYHDPKEGGRGCCDFGCGHEVVPTKEAERLRVAWEAQCSNVRCAPVSCAPVEQPSPACREGRCVATQTE